VAHKNLQTAKTQKLDEFYTQLADIEKELHHYKDQLKGKVIFCNCDDPYESNFFRYFALNFNRLGLKQLITTSYKPSPIANTQLGLFGDDNVLGTPKGRPKVTANKLVINEVGDIDDDGAFDLRDIAEQLKANKNNEWTPLEGNGDFRSPESIALLKQADILVTNPPFSLFREFITQLVGYNKQFLIIGNTNAITYKEIFKLIKDNKFRTGYTNFNVGMFFEVPDSWEQFHHIDDKSNRKIARVSSACWFTNLDVAKHHDFIPLFKKYNPNDYIKYENYDATEIGTYRDIPVDYKDVMGVPITFLDKFNPDQFEILGMCENKDLYGLKTKVYTTKECQDAYFAKFGKKGTYDLNASGVIIKNGLLEKVYQRILIKIKD
jgi:hypothetical protein